MNWWAISSLKSYRRLFFKSRGQSQAWFTSVNLHKARRGWRKKRYSKMRAPPLRSSGILIPHFSPEEVVGVNYILYWHLLC
jgi:hypothetical protein